VAVKWPARSWRRLRPCRNLRRRGGEGSYGSRVDEIPAAEAPVKQKRRDC
jgi:hypothetical protein